MARIFISYSHTDKVFARQLVTDLEELGADIWIDVEDIPAGSDWSNEIQKGLKTSDVMLLILSSTSSASEDVADEWKYFKGKGKPIIPILLKQAEVHFQLHKLHYIDFETQDYGEALRQLHAALKREGVKLEPISVRDTLIPAQAPLPVKEGAGISRAYWAAGAVVALVLIGAGVVIWNSLGGDDDKDKTPTATLDKDAIALTQVAMWATQTATALTPAPTLTPTERPSDTPELPTATNKATSDPSSTPETPTLTYTPTEEPSNTPTTDPTDTPTIITRATIIPAGASNEWTPIEQGMNGVPLVYVPAGCFEMENADGYDNEKSVHRVCLTDYWIGKTEVTNAQYRQCVEARGCTPPGDTTYYNDPDYAEHPVVYVDWEQAKTYAEWVGGSLPTEAQWEYAARGPEGLTYPWGEAAATCELANVRIGDSGCVGNTKAVGSYPDGASWVGALDMSGNVWEWAADWNDGNYATTGPESGDARGLRGGSWYGDVDRARGAFRLKGYLGFGFEDWGFRVVCAPPQ